MSQVCMSAGAIANVEGVSISQPKHEVVMVVKFNQGEGLILKEPIQLTYYKFGSDTIIGTDGVFYNFYMRNWVGGNDAFGGRKFTLVMHDGEVVECSGQWWSAKSPTAQMLIDQPMCDGTACDLKSMQNCYVFIGHSADAAEWAKLRATYTGPVYEYYDGDFIIKSWLKKPIKLKCFITDYFGKKSLVDENNDIFTSKVIEGKFYLRHTGTIGSHGLYEGFDQGKRNFNEEPTKAVKPDLGVCTECGKRDAWFDWDNGENLCHPCNRSREYYENYNNY